MAVPLTVQQRLNRKLPRVAKGARQWLRVIGAGQRPETRLVFVVGSQRSGTRLPLTVMDFAPEVATFSEGADPFFSGVLLQPLDRVRELAQASAFPVVALKPICETHRVVELLEAFPQSKAIWIYRHFEAAVNSATLKWTSARENVRRLAHGELAAAGWRAGGLRQDRFELVKALYRPDMSLHEANAVMWFLRNNLFFDLGACSRRDLMLVRYESLVAEPQAQFARMFAFLDVPMPQYAAAGVREPGNKSRPFPAISPEIRRLCEDLLARLDAHHAAAVEANAVMEVQR